MPLAPPSRILPFASAFLIAGAAMATPANKAALERHYDTFLAKDLARCTTCHLPSDKKDPENLDEFPHNPFGDRLRKLGEELQAVEQRRDIATRLALVASEDSDGDGVDNETEILAGTNPGDAKQIPSPEQLAALGPRRADFKKLLAAYRWQPFDRVRSPAVPTVKNADWVRTPIDAFIAAEYDARGLTPRPAAPKPVLLRRVYLDLIGLSPTPEEQRAFDEDISPDAYEKVVDRLLADPRHGERWGRHWMDVWRYSDWTGWTDGKQVRDSQRHIWHWRDWIIESLNADKSYDRMIVEMLAGDEVAPDDPATLRATGFLVRNYKMLSREAWLEDTVKHTAQAFLGVTLGCAKCHDHKTDPIAQAEYYQVRAIFEPHQVRTDRIPGELDLEKDGLPRVYDAEKIPATYRFIRGNEQQPDKSREMPPAVPRALYGGGSTAPLAIAPVALTRNAAFPDKREFVVKGVIAASERAIDEARAAFEKTRADDTASATGYAERDLEVEIAERKHAALLAALRAEQLEDAGKKDSDEWSQAAKDATAKQRAAAVSEAKLALHKAKDAKKIAEAEAALTKAEQQAATEPVTAFTPRPAATFPGTSTGRRLAFARWVASAENPLTARVAMNHLWLRHLGRGIVTTPENFGASGARPSHPALLDWLAAEFAARGWDMKAMHRLIVTSSTYRMASTPDSTDAQIDTDNVYLWRMPSRRMEAELVRDNVLHAAGNLDLTMGGPDIDNAQGLTSLRRSLYLRIAAEKEVEFLKIFDGPVPSECYQRRSTVMPQQALALANSELALAQAKALAKKLTAECSDDAPFIDHAFRRILARAPTADETRECVAFLSGKSNARENLVLVLFNHNDFVTIR